jgi:phage gpG-like protein
MSVIEIDVSALQTMSDKLDPQKMRDAAAIGFERGIAQLAAYIQQNKLSGQVLNQRSGRLIQAVGHPQVDSSGSRMTAIVGGPFYGRVHEFGATISVNSPVNMPNIGWRYLSTVVIPARPWLNPSAEEQKPNIAKQMTREVKAALTE